MSTATDMLTLYIAAEKAVLSGQSFRLGERQVTRADLNSIRAGRAEWQSKVNAETAAAAGGTSRYALADFSGDRV